MADKYEDLRTYVAVIDSGGINAAAAALGIAKSAVSRRLGELEDRLGAALITRTTRSFEPTAAGRRYYQGAREVLDAIDALDAGVVPESAPASHKVRMAVDNQLSAAVALALAAPIRSGGLTAEILDPRAKGRRGDVDIWLGAAPDAEADYERLVAGSLKMAVVGSPAWLDEVGRPTSFAQLRQVAGIDVASLEQGGWLFGDAGVQQPVTVLTVPDPASAVSAAAAGLGTARVPWPVAAAGVASGQLEQVLSDREPAGTPLLMWVRKGTDAATRTLADHLTTAALGG